jgi:hypothetical protein
VCGHWELIDSWISQGSDSYTSCYCLIKHLVLVRSKACFLPCLLVGGGGGEWGLAFLFLYFLVLFSKEMIPLLVGYFIVENPKNFTCLSTCFCKGLMIPLLAGYFIVENPKNLACLSLYVSVKA